MKAAGRTPRQDRTGGMDGLRSCDSVKVNPQVQVGHEFAKDLDKAWVCAQPQQDIARLLALDRAETLFKIRLKTGKIASAMELSVEIREHEVMKHMNAIFGVESELVETTSFKIR